MMKQGSGLNEQSVNNQDTGIAHSRALIRVLIPNLALGVVAAVLCFIVVQPWGGEQFAITWLLLQVASYLVRLALGVHNVSWMSLAKLKKGHDLNWHVVFAAVSGGLWGLVLFMLTPGQHVEIEWMVAAILAVVVLLASSSRLIRFSLKLAFILPIALLSALWSVNAGSEVYQWVAAGVSMACGALLYTAFTFESNHRKIMTLQLTNSVLTRNNTSVNQRLVLETKQRENVEGDLQRSRKLFMQGPVVSYRCSGTGDQRVVCWISENISNYGYRAEDIVGKPWKDIFKPARNENTQVAQGVDTIPVDPNEYSIAAEDGSKKYVYDVTLDELEDEQEGAIFSGYIIDITRVQHAHNALAREKERAQVTLASIGDAVFTTDPQGIISFMNSAAELLTGCESSEMCGKPLSNALKLRSAESRSSESSGWIDDPIGFYKKSPQANQKEHVKTEYVSRTGDHGQLTYKVSPIHDGGPEIYGFVLVLFDITHTEELQDELEYQARHDDLTGIYNRWEFENRFEMLLESSSGQDTHHMLMYLDLDQFKLVNDTCGHHAGDELLRQLTAIYGAQLDNNAILARLGGDEFGVLLEGCSVERGREIAESLRDATKAFQFAFENRVFEVGVSIGVVPVAAPLETMHRLMGAADVACYAAKEQGRNHIRLHQDSDEELARRQLDMDWASRLADSMDAGRFQLFYQEIVPVKTPAPDSLMRIEILLRLNNEKGECLTADHFLPSAERYNLMPDLDRWVIREAFTWYQERGYPESVQMNINLSGLSFTNEGFLEFLENLFDEYKVPAEAVCFEVTETVAIQNLVTAGDFIQRLRSRGCRFALDDFGSGLSSFEYLKALQVDYLKIDGKFVTDINTNKVDRAVVDAINSVGHVMELKTIAEYVENDAIFLELKELNVDFAQGFGVGRPKPLNELAIAS